MSRKYQLLPTTQLPAQRVILSSVANKKQLIRMICDDLIHDRLFHQQSMSKYKLVVTGEDPLPTEMESEEKRLRHDLETHHEEADIIIIQQVLKCAANATKICVISDDTDVFVLLLHH